MPHHFVKISSLIFIQDTSKHINAQKIKSPERLFCLTGIQYEQNNHPNDRKAA